MIPTPEQAYELVCEYNEGEFHRKHARIVGDVMRWYANELGYGGEADFWQTVGILHDLDFEQWPEQHCVKEQALMREKGLDESIIHATASCAMTISIAALAGPRAFILRITVAVINAPIAPPRRTYLSLISHRLPKLVLS